MNTDPSDMLKAYKGRAGIIIEMMAQRYPERPRMCLVQVLTLSLILQFVLPSCKARKLLNVYCFGSIWKKNPDRNFYCGNKGNSINKPCKIKTSRQKFEKKNAMILSRGCSSRVAISNNSLCCFTSIRQ